MRVDRDLKTTSIAQAWSFVPWRVLQTAGSLTGKSLALLPTQANPPAVSPSALHRARGSGCAGNPSCGRPPNTCTLLLATEATRDPPPRPTPLGGEVWLQWRLPATAHRVFLGTWPVKWLSVWSLCLSVKSAGSPAGAPGLPQQPHVTEENFSILPPGLLTLPCPTVPDASKATLRAKPLQQPFLLLVHLPCRTEAHWGQMASFLMSFLPSAPPTWQTLGAQSNNPAAGHRSRSQGTGSRDPPEASPELFSSCRQVINEGVTGPLPALGSSRKAAQARPGCHSERPSLSSLVFPSEVLANSGGASAPPGEPAGAALCGQGSLQAHFLLGVRRP